MSIVSVDGRGRMTFPKDMGLKNTRAVVIQAGSFIVTIPLPQEPHKAAGGWLDTGKTRDELKAMTEKAAQGEATRRRENDHRD